MIYKILASFFIFFFTYHCNSLSQVEELWSREYGVYPGNGIIGIEDLYVDDYDNIYIAGYWYGHSMTNDFAILKFSPSGELLWDSYFNGSANLDDYAFSIGVDKNNNVYVAGRCSSLTTGRDLLVIKYNAIGEEQWVYKYADGYSGRDGAADLKVAQDGNIYVTGDKEISGVLNVLTLKLSSNGELLWEKTHGNSSIAAQGYQFLELDSSENILIEGTSTNWENIYFLKYDTSGTNIFSTEFRDSLSLSYMVRDVVVDGMGNIFSACYYGLPSKNIKCRVLKCNDLGKAEWLNSPYDNVQVNSITLDVDGNVIVGGDKIGNSLDGITIKYNSNGEVVWSKSFGAANQDLIKSIKTDPNGNVYSFGSSVVNTVNSSDFVLLNYDSSGLEKGLTYFNSSFSGFDYGTLMEFDPNGNLIVVGVSSLGNYKTISTVKYSLTVGINQLSSEFPEKFDLFQNYPNPFNPLTNIRFNIKDVSMVTLKVYDVLGKEIALLVDDELKPGTYEITFNGSRFSSGVYYYSLIAGDFMQTNKMMLNK